MCVETEFKDRDGKTLESAFETKLTELRAENEKLLAKITQIEEDLELSQENLEITSGERDNMQKVVEELKGKIVELEEQMKMEKEETGRRINEVECEKSELLQKMKTMEESEASTQRFVYMPYITLIGSFQGFFLIYFIADIGSYSQLKNSTMYLFSQFTGRKSQLKVVKEKF